MNFRDLLYEARAGKEWAVMELLTLYDPLLTKEETIPSFV